MLGESYWILVSIGVLILLLFVAAIKVSKKNKRPTDYYNIFLMGIIWTGISVPLQNYMLMILGLVFMGIGGFNHKKWKANRRRWKDLDKGERRVVLIITVLLGLMVLAGLVLFILGGVN